MSDEFITKSGIVLRLAKVNTLSLQDILYRMGYQSAVIDSEQGKSDFKKWYQRLDSERAKEVNEAMNQLLNLCCMFGVENDVPLDAIEELRAIGFNTTSKRILRMHWLRNLVFEDEIEAALFWPEVIKFSTAKDGEEKEGQEESKMG